MGAQKPKDDQRRDGVKTKDGQSHKLKRGWACTGGRGRRPEWAWLVGRHGGGGSVMGVSTSHGGGIAQLMRGGEGA